MRKHHIRAAAALQIALLAGACGHGHKAPADATRTADERRAEADRIRRNSQIHGPAQGLVQTDPRTKARESMQATMAKRWRAAHPDLAGRQANAARAPISTPTPQD